MKRLKHIFKKGMAFVLSLAMVAGLVTAMPGGANKVQAATASGTEPSVSAYATKTQLMDGTFTPDSNGNATTIGKLVFGKKSGGTTAQEWYILGKDEGVSGDNTIIFAASPIATNQVFENDWYSNKTYDSSFGVYTSNPTDVYPNHYGASDLRVALKNMATSETYFTSAEQDLMNDTTVTTKDTENNNVTYTTTDKLYALQGNYVGDNKLWAGTSDSTVLAMDSYRSSGDWFWLRSPDDGFADKVLLADPGYCVYNGTVKNMSAVQPASNLNLSSVLFASSAKAASSDTVESHIIASGTAMTLRFDGTGKDIGRVTYNTTTGDIKVAKGSTSQNVALVVQGNDETNDWYYSKKIDASETLNASAIKSALSLSSIDLSTCKIWLEITDTDKLIYAVNADKEIEPINTTYVTKEQLMSSFKPYSDGTAVNYGKIVFGKKSDGTTAQQWYILGKDTGVLGDNTILFAESPIATGQVFNSSISNKTFESSFGVYESVPTEVYPNHYGASDLRTALQNMATSETYFTSAEQGLMNATTVTTNDTKNSATYTTTDKLYALAADGYGSTTIKAGTSDSTVLAMDSYWSSGAGFWLRSPYDYVFSALLANPGDIVFDYSVNNVLAVQPASNLNLSSVLFASAATAASSDTVKSDTIAWGTAMTLRLNGTGKNIGTVTYNTTTGNIKVAKGSTSQTVVLIVQGKGTVNGEEKDWYYSKKITGTETVNVSAIETESNTPTSIDLSACKIWLEITDTDELIYAVNATEGYEILDGANSSWTQNSDGSLSVRGSGALSNFVGVKVDGTLVDAKNYTVKEGSTIVTLKADYLNTLSVGTHTFEILWMGGSASTTFTIKADSSDNGNNNQEEAPETGDNTPSVWLFILTIISGTGLILTAKKRRKNLNTSEK